MSLIDCSVPEELLRKEEQPFDEPEKFGVRLAYFLGDVRVALYERAVPKVNTFQAGKVEPGFTITDDMDVTYPVEDHPQAFVSIVEARRRGTDEILHRGVNPAIKHGALAGVQGNL